MYSDLGGAAGVRVCVCVCVCVCVRFVLPRLLCVVRLNNCLTAVLSNVCHVLDTFIRNTVPLIAQMFNVGQF